MTKKPNFKQIQENINMWEKRRYDLKSTSYARDDGSTPWRGSYVNGIWWEDCSSFVSVLVNGQGQDTSGIYRSYTGEMVGWSNGSQHEQNSKLKQWGFKKVKENPDENFYFKKFDIVVATKNGSESSGGDAHTAMIYKSGKGIDAKIIHASKPGTVQYNTFGPWHYTNRTISVWRARSNIFIYAVKPLQL